jgi:hypothetical protein
MGMLIKASNPGVGDAGAMGIGFQGASVVANDADKSRERIASAPVLKAGVGSWVMPPTLMS